MPNGSEMITPFNGELPCVYQTTDILTSDRSSNIDSGHLDSIILIDDTGGGYTTFKLRDLGEILNLTVT